MGQVSKITRDEFKNRILKHQENAKRLKLYVEGHADEEMALACNVLIKEIRAWRKASKLLANAVVTVKARKQDSVMNRGRNTRFTKGCGRS